MIQFLAVKCPRCGNVVGEVATGLARFKCACKQRVWAASDGREVRIVQVDAPQPRLAQSA